MSYEVRSDYGYQRGAEVRMVESRGCGGMQEWSSDGHHRGQGARGEAWRRRARRAGGSCRHVPHREKAPLAVARRNARERRRVEAVNGAFLRLRRAVPAEGMFEGVAGERGKRVSKVKTLHRAIEYIARLQDVLRDAGCEITVDPYDTRCSRDDQSIEEKDSSYDGDGDVIKWRGGYDNGYRETQVDCVYGVVQDYDGEY